MSRSGFYKKQPRKKASPKIEQEHLRMTRALLKFCIEHNVSKEDISDIKSCLDALELDDINQAWERYIKLKIWGMGSISDQGPNEEYLREVFLSLLTRWVFVMSRLEQ